LERIAEEKGPQSVGGIASARVSNEAAYLFQKFLRVLVGTNNVDYPDGAGVRAHPTGLSAIADIAKSDVVVLVGIDPSEHVPVLDLHIKRAVLRKGQKLVIINPRRIELARYTQDARTKGGAYLPVYPGQEASLLSDLASAVQGAKAESQPAARAQGTRPAGQPPVTAKRPVPPALAGAVDALAGAKSPLFIYGPDAARGEQGRQTVAALSNLASTLGHGDKLAYIGAEANSQGARDMGMLSDSLPGHLPVSESAVRERLGKLWGVQPPAEAGRTYAEMLDGGVRGLYVMGANPAAVLAHAEALRKLDFLVVQDLFLTETAQLAEVVLPATSFAEADGTYTNLERRVQRGPEAVRTEGESRADWAILAALGQYWLTAQTPESGAEAVKVPDWKRKKTARGKTGPAPKPWHYSSVQAVDEEISKAVPVYGGLRWDTLGELGVQWPASALTRAARRPEPLNITPLVDRPAGAFWLVSSPLLWDGDVLMQHAADEVRAQMPAPFVALNPADIATLGLTEGAQVTVSSAAGAVVLALRSDPHVQPGSAWVPYKLIGLPAETLGAGRGLPVNVTVR